MQSEESRRCCGQSAERREHRATSTVRSKLVGELGRKLSRVAKPDLATGLATDVIPQLKDDPAISTTGHPTSD
jgi:hypothetical protein